MSEHEQQGYGPQAGIGVNAPGKGAGGGAPDQQPAYAGNAPPQGAMAGAQAAMQGNAGDAGAAQGYGTGNGQALHGSGVAGAAMNAGYAAAQPGATPDGPMPAAATPGGGYAAAPGPGFNGSAHAAAPGMGPSGQAMPHPGYYLPPGPQPVPHFPPHPAMMHPGYMGQPMGYAGAPGIPPGIAAAGMMAGAPGAPGYGKGPDMAEVMEGIQNGDALSSLSKLLNFDDKDFWKGALVGAAAVLLLTNENVQGMLFKTGVKAKDAVQSGVDKVKEKVQAASGDAAGSEKSDD